MQSIFMSGHAIRVFNSLARPCHQHSHYHFAALDSPKELSGDEFDVSDLNPEDEAKMVSKCGNLLVQFTYVVEGRHVFLFLCVSVFLSV